MSDVEIGEGSTCGFYCPTCNFCDATIIMHRPFEGVLFELECEQCGHVWWQS